MQLFDTHTHLDLISHKNKQEPVKQIWERAQENGTQKAMQIGIDLPTSQLSLQYASTLNGVYASIGYHPSNEPLLESQIEPIKDLAQRERAADNAFFLAIGEVGLDYYWITDTAQRERQAEIFSEFIDLSRELKKTLIIHCRNGQAAVGENATDHCAKLLAEQNNLPPTIMHCYGGSAEEIEKFINLGCYISFAGNITFRNALDLQEAVKLVPLDRLLIETDAPYLTPVPYRGQLNEPRNLRYTFDYICNNLDKSPNELADCLWKNSHQVFQISE